ncbi:MAG: IPT/TIG domain-containing protein [Chloroflexi bacterium]|nr:IPT/TIG domain-containing protein [Chloroflexota bacterium]
MMPLHAGGSRLGQAVQRIRNWSLTVALGVSLILGAVLGQSTLATAQPVSPSMDPGFFPATGYRIGSPTVLDYFQRHGGVRTFGYPVSSEFPLLGRRVQIFQREMLEIAADGSVTPSSILDPDLLPISHIDGLSLPAADPDLIASAPVPSSPDYAIQALAFISLYVPDDWNGLPVNFQSTFLNTVTCADAFGASDPCDQSALPALALELWGLPTSLPTSDPLNADFVYQRFERGIMHFSRASGRTQGLLLGDWLKRIMVGVDLSPDIDAAVRHSRMFAQYAPSRPLALDRPSDLPDSSLAQAFRADTLSAAGQTQSEPTLPTNVAQTATAVAMTATAITATQVALQSSQTVFTATAFALTATAAVAQATQTPTPGTAISSVPVDGSGCRGDEQLWFVPRKPNVGVHVMVSVTSQRHHDVRSMVLSGPVDSGPVVERTGPLGFVWTWTVVPTVEDFYNWTFYADGLRPCNTSGFNAFAPLGATPTATLTPAATNTPGPTATATPQTAPNATGFTPTTGTCGDPITITGRNFGAPPTGQQIPSGGRVLYGARDATIVSWTDGAITLFPPTGAPGGQSSMIVINSGGSSRVPGQYNLTGVSTNGC